MNRKLVAAALACTMLSSPAFAQDGAAAAAGNEEDTIVVTAARSILPANALPLTVDVIGKEALDQQIAISGSVTDAVATLVPSFSPTRQKLSGAGETLRGRAPLYAINGIPQSTPMRDGSRDGFTIDGFFIDRVEVIFGSNALQGIGGTGGIVNQVTVGAPAEEGVSGRALLQATADDDFSEAGMGGKTAGLIQYKAGRFDASVGAAYELRGLFRDGEGRPVGINLTQGETMDSKALSLFGRFGYAVTDTMRLDLIASRFELEGDGDYAPVAGDKTGGLPTSAEPGLPPGVPATGRTESVALSLTDTDLGGGNFVSQIFWNRSRDTFGGEPNPIASFQDPTIAPVGTLFDQSQNRSRKIGGKLSYERAVPGFEALTLIAGFDALWDTTEQRLIATDRAWVPPSEFRSFAPFGQANLKLAGGLVRLAGGARYENVKIKIADYHTLAANTYDGSDEATYGGVDVAGGSPSFDDVLLNGGVIVEPIPGIRAYASYAEGYTVPDIGRITRAVKVAGVDIDNYLDIAPIVSNNREIGVEVKRGPLNASATYFWSTSTKGQLLIARPDGIFDVVRQRVEIEGLEVNLAIKLPIDGLTVSAGYAHIDGRFDADQDGAVDTDLDGANISPDRLNLAAAYANGPVSARVQTQFYLARSFRGPGRDPRNDFEGYNLTDAFVRYQTSLGGISLAVQNLFDEQYISYASDTQRPTDNFFNFAGRGRTFTLGWDYRF
ncbi:TonB-dependent receptor [Sphingopyxis panaciterrulae]|uniref:Iron complex outermembrane receptor protein n=1 Tax=Sphingopyxis panaciterrulae TaxID=462372 RepID=A0A7W9B3I4_9SPHN|nr:TonB-dependent receptor [Sphingopyxis panaciterrulae]MBB5705382.1 iron complex outermembrane receptor protein [Sphingopyxis panaciterrulae]